MIALIKKVGLTLRPKKQKPSQIGPAVSIMLTFIAVQVLSIVAVFLFQSQPPSYFINANVVINLVGAFFALWINYHFNLVYPFERGQTKGKEILTWGLTGTALAYLSQVALTMLEITLFGQPTVSANTTSIMATILANPLFVLLPIISAPILEELVFRKAINGLLVDKIGWIGAAVISSLVFAFIHFDGMILTYSVMGLIFSYVYYKTQNIWGPIIAHMGLNILATILNLLV